MCGWWYLQCLFGCVFCWLFVCDDGNVFDQYFYDVFWGGEWVIEGCVCGDGFWIEQYQVCCCVLVDDVLWGVFVVEFEMVGRGVGEVVYGFFLCEDFLFLYVVVEVVWEGVVVVGVWLCFDQDVVVFVCVLWVVYDCLDVLFIFDVYQDFGGFCVCDDCVEYYVYGMLFVCFGDFGDCVFDEVGECGICCVGDLDLGLVGFFVVEFVVVDFFEFDVQGFLFVCIECGDGVQQVVCCGELVGQEG